MSKRLSLSALVCAVAVLAVVGGSSATAQREPGARVTDAVRVQALAGGPVRVIVGVRAGFTPEGRLNPAAAAAQRAEISGRLRAVMTRLPPAAATRARAFATIPFFAAEVDAVTLLQLEQDPDVVSIEEDVAVPPALWESAPLVGAPSAWASGFTGSGWTVAVLDTGVDKTHPFLSGKVVSEACFSNAGGYGNGISLCPGGATWSTAPGSGMNCSGAYAGCDHGTHVAGIAAGSGSSFQGVARGAGVISIQVFTGIPASYSVTAFFSDVILGLERVLALRTAYNIAAVNMSLGGGRYYDQGTCDAGHRSIKAAIDNLRSVGIASVIASGNSGYSDSVSVPGCISSAVSVGSTTKWDAVSGFSNTAYFLSLLAPGSSIVSSVPGNYAYKDGTSMAAPHVAGAWALAKQRKPSASVTEVLTALRNTGVWVTDPLSNLAFPRIRIDQAINTFVSTEMSLDAPANGAIVGPSFSVAGWALDPAAAFGTGVNAIHVYAFPATGSPILLGGASYGSARGDVGSVYGARFTNSGFNLPIAGSLAPGTYRIAAYAHSLVSGNFDASRSATVTVTGPVSNPLASIDTPASGATVAPSFLIAGWAIDTGAPGGSGVDAIHVYAFSASGSPIFLGGASYGGGRPDVGAVFGSRFTNSGFELTTAPLAPGAYTIAVYFRSTLTGTFAWRTRSITVREPGDPLMAVDTPTSGGGVSQPFLLDGWAIDRDAASGTGVDAVHAWAIPSGGGSPIFLGAPEYGGARPDVGAVFGSRFGNCGYHLSVSSLPPGSYQVVVYAHSTVTGTFNQWSGVAVTVQN